ASISIALTDELTRRFGPLVDAMLAESLKEAKPEERGRLKALLDSIAPTLKAGELDSAIALIGPDAKGRHALLAALAVKRGKELDKQVRAMLKDVKDFAEVAAVTYDVDKVGAFTLHKVTLKDVPEEVEKFFGSR